MIKEEMMYTVICDNCGADVNEESDFKFWNDESYVKQCADDADWVTEGDKHYCPECVSYDDEDNLILKDMDLLKNKSVVIAKYPDAYERVYASRSMVIWCPLLNIRLSGFFLTFKEAWADAVNWIDKNNERLKIK